MNPEIFSKDTTAIVYGYQQNAIQRMSPVCRTKSGLN